MNLSTVDTPALILDEAVLTRNISRVHAAVGRHSAVSLRPHFKTAKSLPVLERIFLADRKATVSTIREAEVLCGGGIKDILYAVGITPDKLERIGKLQSEGAVVTVVLDSVEVARAVAAWSSGQEGRPLRVMIEVDSDGHRAGVDPRGESLLAIGRVLGDARGIELAGVMTHAGSSYDCTSVEGIVAMAEQERSCTVEAAQRLRAAGYPCPQVSIGSTPTILFARSLVGVTEARVGVAYFNDLTMTGLGVCSLEDIALSVLTTVTGHQPQRNRILVDAGWMALSADRGRASQQVFRGMGQAMSIDGRVLPGLGVTEANQEHGLLSTADGSPLDFARFPIGSRLRILPNHACATAAAFDEYHVLLQAGASAAWKRCSGW